MDWPAAKVRRTFLEYFCARRGHAHVPSSPVVPHDDPTLLFTNAGMNQFKPIFLGSADPGTPLGRLKRAANSQKCIRAGGKHNDLEDVGKDTYHHTFFEMLGNWSFGDYFKKEAIEWAWELLTSVYGIAPDRLYATYFQGNPGAGLAPDDEARELWLRYLPDSRVIPGGMKDNFWEMGEAGPCGPCSEIHYDRIGGREATALVNAGDPDVIEVWNNVFIQFERLPGGSLRPLPARHVDTGMGLERLVSVLQDRRSNYDTDVFAGIFRAVEEATGARAYMGRVGVEDKDNVDTAYRVVADHARCLVFAITDGALPSNVGRGYVLRRILRRAARYARQMLGARPGLMARLVPTVVDELGEAFPELRRDPSRVAGVILEEEESFGRTLDRGIKLFAEVASSASAQGRRVIGGDEAFRLYDTYGFPADLTALMASERGLTVDMEGYEREREKAEAVSRAGGKAVEAASRPALDQEAVARLRALHVGPTDDLYKYDPKVIGAHVRAIWNGHTLDEHAKPGLGRPVGLVLDRTSFYAEMGGQEADHGVIRDVSGAEFRVEHVSAFGGYVLHVGHVVSGEFRVGERVELHVDRDRRSSIERNHTATHLLNFALREVLGEGVEQKGSLVSEERLRFDFAHGQPVSAEEAGRVEGMVNERVAKDLTVYAQPAELAVARGIAGVRAVFGEAYPDPVRVVSIGQPVMELTASPGCEAWRSLSVEFCGGTHVASTSAIGSFALVGEEAVAKGVRRVVALTGEAARSASRLAEELSGRVERAGKTSDDRIGAVAVEVAQAIDAAVIPISKKAELRAGVAALQERAKAAAKAAGAAKRESAVREARGLAESALMSPEMVFVGTIDAGDDRQALSAGLQVIAEKAPRNAVMLFSVVAPAGGEPGKVSVVAQVPAALVQKGLKAGDWVREVAAIVGGKGGGKPDNAQGGGSETAKVHEAADHARRYASRFVG
ncbi:MAG: alanine--tRNA ligase [Phycisphaeraceae bacterium]|nr:MAG: alanine--tRNA ligase [Phycisphaeraceae bacterium]